MDQPLKIAQKGSVSEKHFFTLKTTATNRMKSYLKYALAALAVCVLPPLSLAAQPATTSPRAAAPLGLLRLRDTAKPGEAAKLASPKFAVDALPTSGLAGVSKAQKNNVDTLLLDAGKQFAKFRQSIRGLHCIIRAHVEAVANRIRRTRAAFQKRGIIRRRADLRVVRARRLSQHAGEPDVRETHRGDRRDGRVIDVREFPASIFRQRSVRLPRLVHISKKTRQQLVDAHPLAARRGA